MKRLHADDPIRAYRFQRFSLRPSSNPAQDRGATPRPLSALNHRPEAEAGTTLGPQQQHLAGEVVLATAQPADPGLGQAPSPARSPPPARHPLKQSLIQRADSTSAHRVFNSTSVDRSLWEAVA